jgi:predicted RNA-binding protein with RPS1 domain
LVHISEIAWSRIAHPSDVLTLGQTVKVVVLKREVLNGKAKISLSIKQATPREVTDADKSKSAVKDDSWSKLLVGQVFQGKVNRKEAYGLFVQLEPGITGLLHKSRAPDNKDFHFDKVRVNDVIGVSATSEGLRNVGSLAATFARIPVTSGALSGTQLRPGYTQLLLKQLPRASAEAVICSSREILGKSAWKTTLDDIAQGANGAVVARIASNPQSCK